MTEVPLADALANLRAELQRAMSEGADEPLHFELDSVVLELDVALTSAVRGEAKAGLWSVLTLGTSADHTRGSTHRLTLTLTPRLTGAPVGEKVSVGDDTSAVMPPPSRE